MAGASRGRSTTCRRWTRTPRCSVRCSSTSFPTPSNTRAPGTRRVSKSGPSRATEPLALVLLDLKMPKVDGLEVLRQIKSDPVLRLTPVVMLTSSREEVDLLRSYQLGVNAYVVKPVAFGEFMEAVRQLGAFWAVLNERPPMAAASSGGTHG